MISVGKLVTPDFDGVGVIIKRESITPPDPPKGGGCAID